MLKKKRTSKVEPAAAAGALAGVSLRLEGNSLRTSGSIMQQGERLDREMAKNHINCS